MPSDPRRPASAITEFATQQPGTDSKPTSVAFFDMDGTVLRSSSGKLYLRYMLAKGYIPWRQRPAIVWLVGLYAVGFLDFPNLMARLMGLVAGTNEDEVWRISSEWYEAELRHYITDKAKERIAWHRSQGHQPVLISASTVYAVRPVAQDLGLGDSYLATHLQVRDGQLTGRLDGTPCYGPGKVALARSYLVDARIDITECYFYSDGFSDMPLLEAVGHPVAVNPDRRLARAAEERGWPIAMFY